jgi:hypothetical protein
MHLKTIYSVIRFLAHWLANCTICVLVYINCQTYSCPGHLRPLSVIAEKVPNNYIFAFGMGTSALLTIILVVTLHVSVSNFLISKSCDSEISVGKNKPILNEKDLQNNSSNQGNRLLSLPPRVLQLTLFSRNLCILGVFSYFCLFIVTITHAHRQGFLHSFFGVLHFFSSWGYSVCVQILRLSLLDTYDGVNDVDGERNKSRALYRFQISRYMLLLLMVFDLAFGTLWIYVNIYSSQRHKYMGLESVLEVIAVLIQINYCCSMVFDSPGRCVTTKMISGQTQNESYSYFQILSLPDHTKNKYKKKYSIINNNDTPDDDAEDEVMMSNCNNTRSDDLGDVSCKHALNALDVKYKCKDIWELFVTSILPCISISKK